MVSAPHTRTNGLLVGVVLALACGNGDDFVPESEPERVTPPVVEEVEDVEDVEDTEVTPVPEEPPLTPPPNEGTEPGNGEPAAGTPCVTPFRVSGAPTSIPEALVLMNALPRPTSLECFLQSLTRPLALFMTSSPDSLQPSPGSRSPRTFIVNGPLVMSIVFDGIAHDTLELGFRTSEDRSIKTEILFPLERDVTLEGLFDRVVLDEGRTMCGACHIGEIRALHAAFPAGVFESNVIEPAMVYEVDLESLRAEEAACDPEVERTRCGLLTAVLDHGEVRQTTLGLTDPF